MEVRELLPQLEALTPLELAEPWDKVGLQVGRQSQDVQKALLCIDLTKPVVLEAIEKKMQYDHCVSSTFVLKRWMILLKNIGRGVCYCV